MTVSIVVNTYDTYDEANSELAGIKKFAKVLRMTLTKYGTVGVTKRNRPTVKRGSGWGKVAREVVAFDLKETLLAVPPKGNAYSPAEGKCLQSRRREMNEVNRETK